MQFHIMQKHMVIDDGESILNYSDYLFDIITCHSIFVHYTNHLQQDSYHMFLKFLYILLPFVIYRNASKVFVKAIQC